MRQMSSERRGSIDEEGVVKQPPPHPSARWRECREETSREVSTRDQVLARTMKHSWLLWMTSASLDRVSGVQGPSDQITTVVFGVD